MLREKAEAIEEYKDRARRALEDQQNSLEEYIELIDEGKSLNVDLPALDMLERIVDQLKWFDRAKEMNDVYLSLEEVLDLMARGERCGISPNHRLMEQLAMKRDKGRWWENQTTTLLSMEAAPVEALEALLNDATQLSVTKETYVKVETIINRTREARQHLASLMSRFQVGNILERPLASEARKVLKVIDELPVKPRDSTNLKKMIVRTEEWVKRGKRLFGKTNASVMQLEEHLILIQKRNESAFDTTDVPKRDKTSSPGPHSPDATETKDSEEGPYCICRSGPTGEMVECDKCKEWYFLLD
jgi:histone demethylase JARID1